MIKKWIRNWLMEQQEFDTPKITWSPTEELIEYCLGTPVDIPDEGQVDADWLARQVESWDRLEKTVAWQGFIQYCRAKEEKLLTDWRRGRGNDKREVIAILHELPKIPDIARKRLAALNRRIHKQDKLLESLTKGDE